MKGKMLIQSMLRCWARPVGKGCIIMLVMCMLILYSILLHLAIIASNKQCHVVWNVTETVLDLGEFSPF